MCTDISDSGNVAIQTSYHFLFVIKEEWSKEPLPGGDDDVIELGDLGSPRRVRFIEVEVVE